MTGDLGSSLTCRRFDLSTPALIFGGLLLAATALRGLDAAPAFSAELEEVKVLAEQPTMFTAGPKDFLMMGCQNERAKTVAGQKLGQMIKRCKTVRADH